MKQLILNRSWGDERVTLGMLRIRGIPHDPFFTLENPVGNPATYERIPEGDYICKKYSGTKFKDVFEVTKVEGRTAILMHPGNTVKDTKGCILIGLGCVLVSKIPTVTSSQAAFEVLRRLLGKEDFKLTIVDPYGESLNHVEVYS